MSAYYAFSYGPTRSYRNRSSEHATLQAARDAACNKRLMGWSTSRIHRVERKTERPGTR